MGAVQSCDYDCVDRRVDEGEVVPDIEDLKMDSNPSQAAEIVSTDCVTDESDLSSRDRAQRIEEIDTSIDLCDVYERMRRTADETLDYMHAWLDDPDFEFISSSRKGVRVWRKDPPGEPPIIKGTMNFGSRYTLDEVRKYFWDINNKKVWDDQLVVAEVLKTYCEEADYGLKLEYQNYANQWGVTGRDFLSICCYRRYGSNRILTAARSVWDTGFEDQCTYPNKVRGNMMGAGYDYLMLPNGDIEITIMMQVDLGGYLPKGLACWGQTNWPFGTLPKIKKHADKTIKDVPEDVDR